MGHRAVHILSCRLAHDRELSLFGGERLVHKTSYNALKEKMNIGDDKMREMYVLFVDHGILHPFMYVLIRI